MKPKTEYPTPSHADLPEYEKYAIAQSTYRAIQRYFAQPGVQEAFERWLADAKGEDEGTTNDSRLK